MGMALVRGLIARQAPFDISVYDRRALDNFPAGVKVLTELSGPRSEQVICLCVKPQDLKTVAAQIGGKIELQSLIISILAGTPLAELGTVLQHPGAIVRAMPNIAATVGAAATAACHNAACTEPQQKVATQIFGCVGEIDWTREELMDAVTGLSGSGPAYIYMVIEALTDGGVKMGIPRDLAGRLATQTVLGSAMLVKETKLHPAILRDQVTTPGGTTISAIHELEAHGLRAMLISAVATATKRSAQLKKKIT
jgi:pyrroline-5-carboxylate reductase